MVYEISYLAIATYRRNLNQTKIILPHGESGETRKTDPWVWGVFFDLEDLVIQLELDFLLQEQHVSSCFRALENKSGDSCVMINGNKIRLGTP